MSRRITSPRSSTPRDDEARPRERELVLAPNEFAYVLDLILDGLARSTSA